jgi:F-type H+-transporting ATPase subunit gamma
MSRSKEIRNKMGSIKKTQKITSAMELVAASKMRKAQDRMATTKPYAEKILSVIGHLANAHPEYHHPYLQERPIHRVGFIVVSTDRGLCGGLNTNLLKPTLQEIKRWRDKGVEVDLCLIGNKANHFFSNIGGNVVASATHLGDAPSVVDIVGVVKVMLDNYDAGTLDSLFIAENQFINTMAQKPRIHQLLPLIHSQDQTSGYHWDYIYEPDAQELIDTLLKRYIESQVYQAVVENIACEQAARMVAMKSATENAGDLINDLKLAYNKARQAAITQEIAEIMSGSGAV